MAALLLSAVSGSAVHTGIAFTADHLEKAPKVAKTLNFRAL